jgi:cytochrome c biogenesis protein CcmG/thiol:disulfide interchange protein DsbE
MFLNYSGKFPIGSVAAAVIAFILCLSTVSASAAGRAEIRVGDIPPAVALHDLNGSVVRFPGDYRGKVVILHFWAGGCSSCREEMPDMEALYGKYRKKGLVILAVNVGQRRDIVKGLVRGLGISYPVLLDSEKKMSDKYDVVGLPRTYLIDRTGVIRYKILGSASVEMLQKRVLSML